MRRALVTTVLAGAALYPATMAAAATVSPARIARAVRTAERSHSLWATVNICDTKAYRHDLGIRGQMPSLGFSSSLSMVVQVNYWSLTGRRFLPIQSKLATTRLSLGTSANGLQQDGAVFPFSAHTGRLNATVTFTWSRDGDQLGQVTQTTTGGHPQAAFGQPPHHSSATCKF